MRFQGKIVPCSDGAGTIIALSEEMKLHQGGDKVSTSFSQAHQSGFVTPAMRQTSLGAKLDGVMRQYAIFDETRLHPAPPTLSLSEASTLPYAAVTALNALYGIADRGLKTDGTVLTQGTGGVFLFSAQFALVAEATVIATYL